MLTRRALLKGGVASASLVILPGCSRRMGRDADYSSERIARSLREYDAQGWHRTGSEVDTRSAEWLADEVRSRGLDVNLEPFELARIDILEAFLEIDGERVDGLPVFDGGTTDADGIRGTLGPITSGAKIPWVAQRSIADQLHDAVTSKEARASQLAEARGSGRRRAIVAFPARGSGVLANNAPRFPASIGPAVLQIDGAKREWVLEHGRRGSLGRVVARVKRSPTRAFNVVARAPGRDPAAPPIVVMTPRSGWWNCAAERSGGISIWLELISSLRSRTPARDILFVATSGHELGFLGLTNFLHQRPDLIRGALVWLHLGASIGAAKNASLVCAASESDFQEIAVRAFAESGAVQPALIPPGQPAFGEVDRIQHGGGRYLSIMGGNSLFHLDSDRGPGAVSIEETSRYARAFTQLLATIGSGAGEALRRPGGARSSTLQRSWTNSRDSKPA